MDKEKQLEKTNNIIEEYHEEKCNECGSEDIYKDHELEELICNKCGLILVSQQIDYGPEWRVFDSESNEKRSRGGTTASDKILSTEISWKDKDSQGKNISSSSKIKIFRLRKWQKRIRTSNASERNLSYALTELDRLSHTLKLPPIVRDTAASIYKKSVNKNLIRGRSMEGVVAASQYAACRECDIPRTLDEISIASSVNRKEIGRTYRFITRELNLKFIPTKPQDYINRFCSELNLSNSVLKKTLHLLKIAHEKELTSGKGPTGVAAAAIYISSLMCGERRTQREVAQTAGVTEVTIRNRYKELNDKLDILLNSF